MSSISQNPVGGYWLQPVANAAVLGQFLLYHLKRRQVPRQIAVDLLSGQRIVEQVRISDGADDRLL
jgi:hypothetical protein